MPTIRAWLVAIFAGVAAVAFSPDAAAQPCSAGSSLESAHRGRQLLANLDVLQAYLWREQQISTEMYSELADDERDEDGHYARLEDGHGDIPADFIFGTMRRSDDFRGFEVCDGTDVRPAVLERSWWGVYEESNVEAYDGMSARGVKLFYLSSRDALNVELGEEHREVAYGQALVGAEYTRDPVSVMVAGVRQSYPDEGIPGLSSPGDVGRDPEWSMLATVGIPRWGVALSLGAEPGFRGIDTAKLGLTDFALPFGLRGSLVSGYVHREMPLLSAAGLYGIPGGLSIEAAAHPFAAQFRFARLRWRHPFVWDFFSTYEVRDRYRGVPVRGESHYRIDLRPFLETSINRRDVADASDDPWLFGLNAGATVRWMTSIATIGLRVHVGVNDPDAMVALPQTANHLQWGTQLFFQFGI